MSPFCAFSLSLSLFSLSLYLSSECIKSLKSNNKATYFPKPLCREVCHMFFTGSQPILATDLINPLFQMALFLCLSYPPFHNCVFALEFLFQDQLLEEPKLRQLLVTCFFRIPLITTVSLIQTYPEPSPCICAGTYCSHPEVAKSLQPGNNI